MSNSPIWFPYTQMLTAPIPTQIVRGEGAWLHTADGRKILDAISSWWVNAHGHAHPHIAEAIATQALQLEQVIFAGFTHPQAERLARRLVHHLPQGLEKIFFSDDGSTAVEVALKMAWQHWQHMGESRKSIAALGGAYHGDTFGAMSVSGRGIFTKAFEPLLFEVTTLPGPGEAGFADTCEHLTISHQRSPLAAVILEPLVQGAAGMVMYSPAQLRTIADWCKAHRVLLIADEVMTGFWRTGTFWACEQAGVQPDLLCMSKALTGGFLPMGITACTQSIYDSFLSEDRSRALFHGHSYTANPLACAAANASLDLFEDEGFPARITALCAVQERWAQRLAQHPRLRHVRRCGTILAMDLASEGQAGYLSDAAKGIAIQMLEKGFLIRPLGEVIYTLPPYCVSAEEMDKLYLSLCAILDV
jgi:adenosylmethionine-8-amino-7-oxononanoate aminotransferase